MKKRILITYVSYGSGHKTAAKYIENYFNSKEKYEVKTIDLSDYNTSFGKLSEAAYNLNFKFKGSSLFTLFYKFFDHKISTFPYKVVTSDLYDQDRLSQDIQKFNPNLTISTHFFGSILITKYNKKGLINSKIITVLTDYKSHEIWIKNFKNENALIVGNEVIKNELVTKGLDKNKIYPFGIPLSEKFMDNLDKEETYKKYKLSKNTPIISFLNGSVGSMNSYDYLKIFLKKRYNVQTIMFCGRNQKLKEKCENLVMSNNYKNVTILPFTTDVNNILNISSLVVTKPGGLSTTECLELKRPMMLIPGNGGPEIYNAKFLCSKGFAFNNKNVIIFYKNIKKIMRNPNILINMNKKLSKYEKNTSVVNLYKLSEQLLRK